MTRTYDNTEDKELERQEKERLIEFGIAAAPICNHYGAPTVEKRDGKYFLFIDNWDGKESTEVSQKFYDTFVAEFSQPRK